MLGVLTWLEDVTLAVPTRLDGGRVVEARTFRGIHAPRVLGRDIRFQVEIANLATKMNREVAGIEARDRGDAAAPGQNRFPGARDIITDRGDHP